MLDCDFLKLLFSQRSFLNGITLNGVFYVTGGTDDSGDAKYEVYAWNSESGAWIEAGHMREPRSSHDVTLIQYGNGTELERYGIYCDD